MQFFKLVFFYVLSVSLFPLESGHNQDTEHCVWLTKPGDRLGDYLLHYIKAKWVSNKNQLPLFLGASKYYVCLELSDEEVFLFSNPCNENRVVIKNIDENLDIYNLKENTSFIVKHNNKNILYEDISFTKGDKEFYSLIKKMVTPAIDLKTVKPNKDVLSVAIHIRTGKGYDNPLLSEQYFTLFPGLKRKYVNVRSMIMCADTFHPDRFPPEIFYCKALQHLSEKLGHPPLYVYLFTDDQNPKELKKRIEEYVGLGNITFDSREDSGEEIVDVLADFFSIQNFNYLIRSLGSHFAIAADYLSDHDLVITSKQRHWEKDCLGKFYLIVDSINIREGNKEEEVLLKY